MKLPIIALLSKPKNLIAFGFTAGVLFYANYWAMANLPGHKFEMCMIGANLTPFNILVSAVLSIMAGLVVAGFVELAKQKQLKSTVRVGSVSTVGLTFGMLTSFCTLCTIPVISLFGLSISLTMFTDYQVWFQGVSIGLLLLAAYLQNRQLQHNCLFGSCGR